MIDTIYKAVKQSHLKKLQIIQNINNLMIQAIFIWNKILIKQIIVFSTPFYCRRKQIFEKMPPGGMKNFPLPRM